jgi:hypothetical protein
MANRFAPLAEEQPEPRPNTPTNQITATPLPPPSPRKKARAKRRATSPPPKEEPKKAQAERSTTEYLYLARDALYAAIETEKQALTESYIADNDIQLLYNELQEIIDYRPMIFRQPSSNLELDIQFGKINAKLDSLTERVTKQSNERPKQAPSLPKEGASKNPLSFAEVLKRPQTQQNASIPPKVTTYRERRLILQGSAKKYPKIDSKGLRDAINKAFKEKCQIVTPVIGTVTKSQKGGDIILSTTEKFDAEFLKKNEAIWKPLFDFNRAIRDTTWYKVVLHGIPTDIFNTEGGMTLLEEEIKDFNGLHPISRPNWLSSSLNRAKKQYGSAIVSFETKSEADRALRNRLQIAGISVKTAEYIQAKPKHKPTRYERFSHIDIPPPSRKL